MTYEIPTSAMVATGVLGEGRLQVREPILVLTGSGMDAQRYGPPHVLLVSSDGRDRGRIGGPLHDAGCRLHSAHTIQQAKACIDSGPVDVILTTEYACDGGWRDLLEHCENVTGGSYEVATVVILAHADPARMALILERGATDAIAHPIDPSRLIRTISVAHARVMRWREIQRARMSNPRIEWEREVVGRGGEDSE